MALHFYFDFSALFNNWGLYQIHHEFTVIYFGPAWIIWIRMVLLSNLINIVDHLVLSCFCCNVELIQAFLFLYVFCYLSSCIVPMMNWNHCHFCFVTPLQGFRMGTGLEFCTRNHPFCSFFSFSVCLISFLFSCRVPTQSSFKDLAFEPELMSYKNCPPKTWPSFSTDSSYGTIAAILCVTGNECCLERCLCPYKL
jgi:hypothetical protein